MSKQLSLYAKLSKRLSFIVHKMSTNLSVHAVRKMSKRMSLYAKLVKGLVYTENE